LEEHCDDLLS